MNDNGGAADGYRSMRIVIPYTETAAAATDASRDESSNGTAPDGFEAEDQPKPTWRDRHTMGSQSEDTRPFRRRTSAPRSVSAMSFSEPPEAPDAEIGEEVIEMGR